MRAGRALWAASGRSGEVRRETALPGNLGFWPKETAGWRSRLPPSWCWAGAAGAAAAGPADSGLGLFSGGVCSCPLLTM